MARNVLGHSKLDCDEKCPKCQHYCSLVKNHGGYPYANFAEKQHHCGNWECRNVWSKDTR